MLIAFGSAFNSAFFFVSASLRCQLFHFRVVAMFFFLLGNSCSSRCKASLIEHNFFWLTYTKGTQFMAMNEQTQPSVNIQCVINKIQSKSFILWFINKFWSFEISLENIVYACPSWTGMYIDKTLILSDNIQKLGRVLCRFVSVCCNPTGIREAKFY